LLRASSFFIPRRTTTPSRITIRANADMDEVKQGNCRILKPRRSQGLEMATGERIKKITKRTARSLDVHPIAGANRGRGAVIGFCLMWWLGGTLSVCVSCLGTSGNCIVARTFAVGWRNRLNSKGEPQSIQLGSFQLHFENHSSGGSDNVRAQAHRHLRRRGPPNAHLLGA